MSNAVMRTIRAVIGRVLIQRDGDDFGEHLGRVFLAGHRVRGAMVFEFDGQAERGRGCPAIEAKHLINAAEPGRRFCRRPRF